MGFDEWFASSRQPEPEVMEDEGEAEVYQRQAAEPYLMASDNRFIARALSFDPRGLVVDIGTGPGQIPIALAAARPGLHVLGVDLSDAMLGLARHGAEQAGVADRARFIKARAEGIPVADGSADLVISNSTLHHLANPVGVFDEAYRILRPGGHLIVRDLRRPSRLTCPAHIAFFGRRYRGRMRELFGISIRAAYTTSELRALMARSRIADARVFREGPVHIVGTGMRPVG